MTTHKSSIKINESINADFILEIDKDLSLGYWNGEVIFSDFDISTLYNAHFEPIPITPCLTSLFLAVIEKEFYSKNCKTNLYEDCLQTYYEVHGIMVKEEVV